MPIIHEKVIVEPFGKKKTSPDRVVRDYILPYMTGWSFCELARVVMRLCLDNNLHLIMRVFEHA
jgi:hypothetical protein